VSDRASPAPISFELNLVIAGLLINSNFGHHSTEVFGVV
jgi:hypothetical protein